MRVLVLEDEEASRKALVKMIQGISGEITADAAADLASARELLYSAAVYDLFLLDVNLDSAGVNPDSGREDDLSGIRFAEEVRAIRRYEFTALVMVTSVAGMEMDAYRRLHCYQYIVKPYEQREIQELVRKILFYVQPEEKPSVVVKKDGINYKIPCEEIVFCKSIPRGVCLCLKKEQMNVPYLTIRQLLEKLPGNQFFQCHRMYIVNKDAVRYFDLVNQMIGVEGYEEQIDIGVTFKPEIRRMIEGRRWAPCYRQPEAPGRGVRRGKRCAGKALAEREAGSWTNR